MMVVMVTPMVMPAPIWTIKNVAQVVANALGAGLPATLLNGNLLMRPAGVNPLAGPTETIVRI